MKNFMKQVLYFFVGILATQVFGQELPNILIIYTDDLGYHDLSSTGSELYDTPNIDKLAEESISFTNAYSSYPRCVPSRYGLMTATYPVNENQGNLGAIPKKKNLIHQFRQAGYQTSYVGKWHLGIGDSHPHNFGFEHTYAAGEAGGVGSRFYPFNKKRNGKPAKYKVPDVESDGKKGDYISDVLTSETIKFITESSRKRPFLAMLAFYAVHTPLEAKQKDIVRNEKEITQIDYGNGPAYIAEGTGRRKMRQDNANYAGMVENVDMNVGRLIGCLKRLGIEKNTMIVFSSDHGGLSNDGNRKKRLLATSNSPLKAGKGHLYEGGIRVPLLVKWQENLSPRVDRKSIVVGMDIFPTLLDLSLKKVIPALDGKSFASVLQGTETWEQRTVFWHSRKARPYSTGDSKSSAVRSGDFKLIHFFEKGNVELYNLKEDIGENHDISNVNVQKKDSLMRLLATWKKEYLVPSKHHRKGAELKRKQSKRNRRKRKKAQRQK